MATFDAHTYAFPFGLDVSPLQLGFTAGTEFIVRSGRAGRLFIPAEFGYYRDAELSSATRLYPGVGYRYTLFGAFADAGLHAGYMHRFFRREVFELNDNGQYESVRDRGRPAFMAGAFVSLGYTFVGAKYPVSAFLRYEWFVHTLNRSSHQHWGQFRTLVRDVL